MSEINSVLKEIRLKSGLNQKDFANRINMKQNAYSMIELGKNKPSVDLLKTISKEFDVNPATFFEDEVKNIENGKNPSGSEKNNPTANDDDVSNMHQVLDKGIKLGQSISNQAVVFDGYFEENKLAFYLKHSEKRLDGLLSSAIDDLKNVYESYRKLILFSESMGAPDFIMEKFPKIEEFKVYKRKFVDAEFKETYGVITDSKVLKSAKLIDYESNLEHYTFLLNKLIEYIYRYADMYQGYLTSDPLNRTNQHQ